MKTLAGLIRYIDRRFGGIIHQYRLNIASKRVEHLKVSNMYKLFARLACYDEILVFVFAPDTRCDYYIGIEMKKVAREPNDVVFVQLWAKVAGQKQSISECINIIIESNNGNDFDEYSEYKIITSGKRKDLHWIDIIRLGYDTYDNIIYEGYTSDLVTVIRDQIISWYSGDIMESKSMNAYVLSNTATRLMDFLMLRLAGCHSQMDIDEWQKNQQ